MAIANHLMTQVVNNKKVLQPFFKPLSSVVQPIVILGHSGRFCSERGRHSHFGSEKEGRSA